MRHRSCPRESPSRSHNQHQSYLEGTPARNILILIRIRSVREWVLGARIRDRVRVRVGIRVRVRVRARPGVGIRSRVRVRVGSRSSNEG